MTLPDAKHVVHLIVLFVPDRIIILNLQLINIPVNKLYFVSDTVSTFIICNFVYYELEVMFVVDHKLHC